MIEKRTIKKTIPINITEDVYVVKDIKGHEHSINDINTAQTMSSVVEKYDKLKKYIAKIFEDKYLKDIKRGDLVIISENKYDLKTKSFIPNTNSIVTIGYYNGLIMESLNKYPKLYISLKNAWHRGQMVINKEYSDLPFVPRISDKYNVELLIPENHDKIQTVVHVVNDYEKKKYEEAVKDHTNALGVIAYNKQEIARLNQVIESMKHSLSWRITSPFRSIVDKTYCFIHRHKTTAVLYDGTRYLMHNGIRSTYRRTKELYGRNRSVMSSEDFKLTPEQIKEQQNTRFSYEPVISILVPLYNTPELFLREMIESVTTQTYGNWQLCLADGSDEEHSEVAKICKEYYKKDKRIVYQHLEKNGGISDNTNACIELATGDFIGLFDHDDLLTPDCLYEFVASMQEVHHDCVYSDEDKLNDKTKKFEDPHFKPDFSIDLLCSHNYITHFFVVNMDIVRKVVGMRSEYDGSQDHDFIFRCVEQANSVHHVPKILYHWRMHPLSTAMDPESKMYCYTSGKKAIESHFKRVGIDATVEMLPRPLYGMYHCKYTVKDHPLVSILIPNYNHKDLLKGCIESLMNVNTYSNIEIVIVENNSTEQEIFDYYKELEEAYSNVKVIYYEGDFNYSKINNYGVKYTHGEYILFLNNDTKVIEPDSIEDMLGVCQREDVGAVGAKLLYEDDTVQHCGVVVGYHGYATAAFSLIDKNDFGYMGRPRVSWDVSAVTAACLMTKREIFDEVGGFDEDFKVACNDVDLCLKIRSLNKWIVEDVFSVWYHYESKSRGLEDTPEKQARFQNEIARFQKKWPEILKNGDPFHNPNFDLDKGPFTYPKA